MGKFSRTLLSSLVLCLGLSACGIKAPLYLPEKKYPQNVSAPHNETQAQLHPLINHS
jgi:predicted small lipoprotein YifL